MTSSSCCEVELRQGGTLLGSAVTVTRAEPTRVDLAEAVDGERPIEVRVVRADPTLRAEVRIGDSVELILNPGRTTGSTHIASLREEFGEVVVSLVEMTPDDVSTRTELAAIRFELDARPAIRELFERLVEDLERVHLGLARDVVGRTRLRAGHMRGAPRLARPEEDCELLEDVLARLRDALDRIRRQPVHAIARDVVRDRWRPGDRIASDASTTLLQDPDTVIIDGEPRRLGRVRLRRSRPTLDIPEHRALRSEVEDLARRARRIARHSQHCIERLAAERGRWGSDRAPQDSVFASEHVPRIARYERIIERAADLAHGFVALRRDAAFLDEAGPSRAGLAPTPLFQNGRGYREAYAALVAARRSAAPLVSGDEFRIHLRSLARLYEYWCFIQVVEQLRTWFGTPVDGAEYEVTEETWRPDLRPGQQFAFAAPGGATVRVHYEPDILPLERTRPSALPYRATLSTAPLRPDVLVEVLHPDAPPAALVLDAKSTSRFGRDDLWKPTDYRSRILHPPTGTQPVRQVFLLHRAEDSPLLENVPGYLAGAVDGTHLSILGAVPLLPWLPDQLTRVMRRFLSMHLDASEVLSRESAARPVAAPA